MLTTINPTTGHTLASYTPLSDSETSAALQASAAAFPQWRNTAIEQRAALLRAAASAMRQHAATLAELMALEMGKPLAEGMGEVEKSAGCAEYYATHAAQFLAAESIASDAKHSYVQYPPLGSVLGILPWNAPVWLALRFLAPALMAGNCCVMKPDPHVLGTAAKLIEILHQAGLPQHVVINLPIATAQISAAIQHPAIRAVSFTGSSAAGQQVAALAAASLKPAVLELGGSDPCIVLADADLTKAADVVTLSRMINAGQSCIAVKRLLVEASIYPDFCQQLLQRFSAIHMADPLSPDCNIGPLARADLRDNLHQQVQSTLQAGAQCLIGGELPSGEGFFYPATLLTDVKPGMATFEQETFGPVLSVTAVADLDEAIALANATEYGLGASIWTRDSDAIARATQQLQAGQVAVNGIVKTDPRLPSGGIGRSGYGRELGPHGIREFVNVQQIWLGDSS